jgi:hypothetical protein
MSSHLHHPAKAGSSGLVDEMEQKVSVYLEIDKAFLDKNEEKGKKEAYATYGGDDGGKNKLLFPELAGDFEIQEITDDGISVGCGTDAGYVGFTIPLTTELQTQLIEMVVKKLNKFKTLLEAVK